MIATWPDRRELTSASFPTTRFDPFSPVNGVAATRPRIDAVWDQRIDEIVGYQHLGDDWDGQGAAMPTTELLQSAICLAYLYAERRIPPPDLVFPGVTGTVIFEWQGAKAYLEVEVLRPLYADVLQILPGQPPEHWTIPQNDLHLSTADVPPLRPAVCA